MQSQFFHQTLTNHLQLHLLFSLKRKAVMEPKIFRWTLLLLLITKKVLSDRTPSVLEFQNEKIMKLQAQFEELNAKVEFILQNIGKFGFQKDSLLNTQDLRGQKDYEREQEPSLLLIERLEQVERILTDAPEGNSLNG